MADNLSTNKQIAKNTMMLYIRMLLSMVVSLYTSRVVLSTLGIEDYGIYGVVGGVVAMFSFLNIAMSSSTSRFLIYEIGKKNKESVRQIFSISVQVHIILAILIFLLSETIGFWFLNNKLVIPIGRLTEANYVFQFSILSTLISVTQVPYSAMLIAKEEMSIYAYIELLNIILKLLIVYLLYLIPYDKLILYSILTFTVSLVIAFVYRCYCIRRYSESHFIFYWNIEKMKKLFSFSAWNLFGNMSYTAREQGKNFIINIFYGTVMNASSSIATTVQGVVMSFMSNVITAFRPPIIKAYAQGKYVKMFEYLEYSSKICVILFIILTIPLVFNLSFLFHLWLTNVPKMAVDICQVVLIANVFYALHNILIIPIHATGKVKYSSFFLTITNVLSLLLMYFAAKEGTSIVLLYAINIVINFVSIFIFLFLIKRLIPSFSVMTYVKRIFSHLIVLSVLSSFLCYYVTTSFKTGFTNLIVSSLFHLVFVLLYSYWLILSNEEKKKVISLLNKYLKVSNK